MIIILTLDNKKLFVFVFASHSFFISRLVLLPSKIRNAQFLPATEITYECLGRVWQRLRDLFSCF